MKNKHSNHQILTICISLLLTILYKLNQDYYQLKYLIKNGDVFNSGTLNYLEYPITLILIIFIYKKSKIAWWYVIVNSTLTIINNIWNYLKEYNLPQIKPNQNSLETLLTVFEEPRFGLMFYLSNIIIYFVPFFFCLKFKSQFIIKKSIMISAFSVSIIAFIIEVILLN